MPGERALHGSVINAIGHSELTMSEIIGRLTPNWPDTPGRVMLEAVNQLVEAGIIEAAISGGPLYVQDTRYRLTGLGKGEM